MFIGTLHNLNVNTWKIETDILIKCKYHLKLKELKTNEGSEFKELRNGLCEIVIRQPFQKGDAVGAQRVVTQQNSAWVKKDF